MLKQAAILGGLIIAIYAAARYKLARSFDVYIYKFKFTGSIADPKFLIGLNINNPTPYFADVQKLEGKIYANNSLIGIIDENINLKIEKEKATPLDFTVRVMPITAVTNIIKYFTDKEFNLVIRGFIMIDGISLPINYSYDK